MAFANAYSSTFLQVGFGSNKTQKIMRLIPKKAAPCLRVWAKEDSLLKKAQAGRFKRREKNCTRCFDSRNALTRHLKENHDLPSDTPAGELCIHCGYPKGSEDKCQFLAPYEPPCAARAKLTSRKQSQAILIQQYRDNNK